MEPDASTSTVHIAWVVLGGALVPVLVIAGQTGHKLLRVVVVVNVDQELPSSGTS